MPEVSGLEFQKQLQRNKMDIDIIYLTSHSEMMQEAFGRNVVAFLNKDNYEIRLAEILTKYEQELSKVLEIQCEGKIKELELKYVLYIQASNKYKDRLFVVRIYAFTLAGDITGESVLPSGKKRNIKLRQCKKDRQGYGIYDG